MIVKSMAKEQHILDLKKCFNNLRKNNMRLKPAKCTFGLGVDKFLGYLVSQRGIKANPKTIKAILKMQAPKKYKEVQKLTSRLTSLRKFMLKKAERCLPFFDILKGAHNATTFKWTSKC